MGDIGLFVAALAVVYVVPGADMVLLLQTGAEHGRSRAIATVIGLAVARGIHVALAGLGLAALLKASPLAFEVVRVVGAGYLFWLGIAILRTRFDLPALAKAASTTTLPHFRDAALRGLLTNITNPKSLLFCSVLLPQFIHPDLGDVSIQFALLGSVLVLLGVGFDLVYATAGTNLGRWMERNPALQSIQKWVFAALLLGFALSLAVAERPF